MGLLYSAAYISYTRPWPGSASELISLAFDLRERLRHAPLKVRPLALAQALALPTAIDKTRVFRYITRSRHQIRSLFAWSGCSRRILFQFCKYCI